LLFAVASAIVSLISSVIAIISAWSALNAAARSILSFLGVAIGALLWMALLMGAAGGAATWCFLIAPIGSIAVGYALALDLAMIEVDTGLDVSPHL